MKKLLALGLVVALSLTTGVQAKRGGGFKSAKSKPATVQNQPKQQDADFNNTATQPQQPMNAAAQAQQGSRINNFVTGAAAGYLLSDLMSPTEAQAQEKSAGQSSAANKEAVGSNVPSFKIQDPMDPNVIERNAHYARYCLGGLQYMVSGSKVTVLVDIQNQPQRCEIVP